jgi:predicted enzyme related to lactoylglutathione lyase
MKRSFGASVSRLPRGGDDIRARGRPQCGLLTLDASGRSCAVSVAPSFHYVELPARSIERATEFYADVFGWRFESPPPEHGRTDVVYLEARPEVGICTGAAPASGSGIRPAVAVKSIDDTLDRVGRAGGRVVEPKADVGDGYTAAFEDCEGNHIGLWQFKEPQEPRP